MNTTAGKLSDIITIGANVTIPTTHWGTWTGEVLETRETGPLAPEGEFFVTLKDSDGTVQEVRTSRLYTGYLNAAPAPATDAEMIDALEASDTFTVVEDGAHLAELLGMGEVPATDDVDAVRNIILDRIAVRAKWGGMVNVTVAQVANWWECDGIGFVACERAMRSLITDATVQETRYLGALAFDAKR